MRSAQKTPREAIATCSRSSEEEEEEEDVEERYASGKGAPSIKLNDKFDATDIGNESEDEARQSRSRIGVWAACAWRRNACSAREARG